MLQGGGPFGHQSPDKLHLASLCGISLFDVDVDGLQDVNGPGLESLPVL